MHAPTAHDEATVDRAPAERHWTTLYRTGAAAAAVSALFVPIQIVVFLVWPPPLDGTAIDWFTLLHNHQFVGLIDLDLLLVADNVLLVSILLALYVVLRLANEAVMTIAVALGFVGIVMYLASNPAVQMAALADRYAAASTDGQRAIAEAAGEATLAMWQGTAFQCAYLVGSIAGILIGVVMLRSGVFSAATAWLAILANTVGLGLYVPVVGVYIAVFSVLFLEAWYLLVARRLYQLGRGATTPQPAHR